MADGWGGHASPEEGIWPSAEKFFLEFEALDKSSFLAWGIIVKILLTVLNIRTYVSLIISQEQSYNTWIFLGRNQIHISYISL